MTSSACEDNFGSAKLWHGFIDSDKISIDILFGSLHICHKYCEIQAHLIALRKWVEVATFFHR
jgi:hypothetical protein